MHYEYSEEWTLKARGIALELGMQHVKLERIACVKSKGSKSHRTIARIHSLGKVMQLGMQEQPFYTIELISENFDKQSLEEKTKTIIHELLHVPAGFKGGFRQHKPFVTGKKVEELFKKFQQGKANHT